MHWFKKQQPTPEGMELAERCKLEAESLYRSGRMHCAEAVLATISKHFAPEAPAEVVNLASGFGHGSWSQCICGAISGGTVALGLALKEDKKQVNHLTRELHHWFREQYRVTCCKTITSEHKGVCPVLTGEVAGKIAEMLGRK